MDLFYSRWMNISFIFTFSFFFPFEIDRFEYAIDVSIQGKILSITRIINLNRENCMHAIIIQLNSSVNGFYNNPSEKFYRKNVEIQYYFSLFFLPFTSSNTYAFYAMLYPKISA